MRVSWRRARPAGEHQVGAKTVLAMLAGIALGRGVQRERDQPIGPVLGRAMPAEADPHVREITIRHLLSMRAGLERSSGSNYGRWVSSRDWPRFALTRPMGDEPGKRMICSTGTSHILGAVPGHASGRTLHDLARAWLGAPLGFAIPDWPGAPDVPRVPGQMREMHALLTQGIQPAFAAG
jgi:CubicO group peptidase (beta-lactamase class C family)